MSAATDPSPALRRRRGAAAILGACGALIGIGAGAPWVTSSAGAAAPVGVVALGAGSWTLSTDVGALALDEPADARVVPGDVLTFRQTLRLDVDTPARLGVDVAAALPPGLAPHVAVTLDIPGLMRTADDAGYRVSPAQAGTYDAIVTVTFDPATPGRIGANSAIAALAFGLHPEHD